MKKNHHIIIKTEDLLQMRSKGILSEKNKLLLDRRLELEVELNRESSYAKFFKDKCVGCEEPIPERGTMWDWYKTHGNWCQRCCSKAAANASRKNYNTAKEFGLKD